MNRNPTILNKSLRIIATSLVAWTGTSILTSQASKPSDRSTDDEITRTDIRAFPKRKIEANLELKKDLRQERSIRPKGIRLRETEIVLGQVHNLQGETESK